MHIRRTVIDAIVEHARRDSPFECCGLLIGSGEGVVASHEAGNLKASEVLYLVDPADHFAAIRSARAAGLSVVGAYHSHPASAAIPSETDIRDANDPKFVHLIVSLAGATPQVAAYQIRDGAAIEVPMTIERA